MSRSIQTIFNEMIAQKESFSSLAGLTSPITPDTAQDMLTELTTASKVAIWRLAFWVIAFAIWTHENLFDVFVATVEARALEIVPATTRFYVIESLKFQNGDPLVFDDDLGKYIYEDTTSAEAIAKQIIEQASANDVNEVVTIKAAKADGSGGLAKLTPGAGGEKEAFDAYVKKFKIAGTKTIIISEDPDKLKAAYTIEFDPLVMKPDGTLIEDGTSPIQVAMDAYIKGLPFNNLFRVQDLTDAIQAARGVLNAVADVIQAKSGSLAYTDILAVTTEIYLPVAGYLTTTDETGTDAAPNAGSINVLTPDVYDATKTYNSGEFVRFSGIVYKANTAIALAESPSTDPTKWDSASNLTLISA